MMTSVGARTSRTDRRLVFAQLALCALTLLAYSNSFGTGFALDNRMLILGDPRIRQATPQNFSLITSHTYWWPSGEAGIYRPLATFSYLFNYAILGNGEQSAGYHGINLLLQGINVLLAFALARRLVRSFRMSFFIAAVWAVHPVLTESVTNIVGRADLMAGAAVLGGLLLYLNGRNKTGWRRAAWLAGLAAITAAGAFSKESAVILPGIIVLYEGMLGRLRASLPGGLTATAVPLAAMLWQRAAVLRASLPAEFPFVDNPIAGAGFWVGRLTATGVLARYLRLVVWPLNLSSDYSYSEIPLATGSIEDWIACSVMVAVTVLAILLYRKNKPACFFACFAFLNLLPASNLLFPIGTVMAERLLYLPSLGIVACLAIAIGNRAQRFSMVTHPVFKTALLCLLLTGLSVRTWLRNRDWTNDLTMAEVSARTSPASFKVHRLLAAALYRSDPAHTNLNRAVAEADKSIAILDALPDDLDIPGPWSEAAAYHLAKGDTLMANGDTLTPAGGREQFEQTVRIARRSIAIDAATRTAYDVLHYVKSPVSPVTADSYKILASAYRRLGQPENALSSALQARGVNGAKADVYREIADAYLALRRGEEAAIALAEGMFATGDGNLRGNLLELYQSGVDPEGCAVVPGPRGPALNPRCAIVRRDLCEGATRARRPDLRQQIGCSE